MTKLLRISSAAVTHYHFFVARTKSLKVAQRGDLASPSRANSPTFTLSLLPGNVVSPCVVHSLPPGALTMAFTLPSAISSRNRSGPSRKGIFLTTFGLALL